MQKEENHLLSKTAAYAQKLGRRPGGYLCFPLPWLIFSLSHFFQLSDFFFFVRQQFCLVCTQLKGSASVSDPKSLCGHKHVFLPALCQLIKDTASMHACSYSLGYPQL